MSIRRPPAASSSPEDIVGKRRPTGRDAVIVVREVEVEVSSASSSGGR